MTDIQTVPAIIEIPKGSRNKYEFDPKNNLFRLDRVIPSSVIYPTDYGFIPNTLSTDGDTLDILVFISQPTFPGCLVTSIPIGLAKMTDDHGLDPKIIAVAASDPHFRNYRTLDDLGQSYLNEIQHFFETYKVLENKQVIFSGWDNAQAAYRIIESSQVSLS